ncbi:MAG: hypothetical protein AB1Z98_04295 [Nannocystaceae bacterium]
MTSRHRIVPVALAALFAVPCAFLATACVDAPITPDQLEADGQLRAAPLEQSAFSAQERVATQRAAQISAVLAAQADGPLEDSIRFPADVGEINLHLRADGIEGERPVLFRWTHRGDAAVVPGTLTPGDTLARSTSFHIDPERTGPWKVEILGAAAGGSEPVVLFERSFEIFVPSR